MSTRRGPDWRSKLLGVLALLAVCGFTVAVAQCATIAIWPGEAAFTGPLFCASPYNEAIVVADTESYPGGTATNYTLMCVGARGQYRDAGFLLPWLTLWACHTALAFAATSVALALRRARRAKSEATSAWIPDR
ncbi:hypothetical protein [Segniliparus rugosus]|uniref:hypothetical protein n=1 Tax=Segniliparus rugosus TaxID=286804 RepID=UPI0012EB740F|nr:hypothetical protein [Segniliparus rugosus]